MDDYDYDLSEYELEDGLSYEIQSQQVYQEIASKWKAIKDKLNVDDEDLKLEIEDFDKLINYYLI